MSKKICILYTGKPRVIDHAKSMLELLTGGDNEYHIALTTWVDEDTSEFELAFPNSFIDYVQLPKQDDIDRFVANDKYVSMRPLSNYYHQLYIRSKSSETLKKLNMDFDVVVLIRTDTIIWRNISIFYDDVKSNDDVVFVPIGPNWDIYGTDVVYGLGACPDVIFFSNQPTMEKILTQQINISRETQQRGGVYHPETCQLRCFQLLNLEVKRLQFDAFIYQNPNESIGYASLPPGYNIIR